MRLPGYHPTQALEDFQEALETCDITSTVPKCSTDRQGSLVKVECPLGSASARLQRLLRAYLAALAGSALSAGRGRPTGRPSTASGARARRLQSRRFRRL
jgi:hypothetical protein